MKEDLQIVEFVKKTQEHKGDNFCRLVQALANIESAVHLTNDVYGEKIARRLAESIVGPLFVLAENLNLNQADLIKHADVLRTLAKQDLAEIRKDS